MWMARSIWTLHTDLVPTEESLSRAGGDGFGPSDVSSMTYD
jgi:hypothetical protein